MNNKELIKSIKELLEGFKTELNVLTSLYPLLNKKIASETNSSRKKRFEIFVRNNTYFIDDLKKLLSNYDKFNLEQLQFDNLVKIRKDLLNRRWELDYTPEYTSLINKDSLVHKAIFDTDKKPAVINEEPSKVANTVFSSGVESTLVESPPVRDMVVKPWVQPSVDNTTNAPQLPIGNLSIIDEGKKPKLWLKALAGSAGFASGVGLSIVVANVPVLGVAVGIYSTTKLVYNTLHFVGNVTTKSRAKKRIDELNNYINVIKTENPNTLSPEARAELKAVEDEKTNIEKNIHNKNYEELKKNPSLTTPMTKISVSFREKHPIMAKVVDTIYAKPKNPYGKWFVNGIYLGYLVGSVLDVGGKIQHASANNNTVENTVPNNVQQPTNVNFVSRPTNGDTFDLSSVKYGAGSSDGNSLHLLKGIGENKAIFDRSVVVDGEEMWHFLTPDGEGYAWLPRKIVENLINTGKSVGGRL